MLTRCLVLFFVVPGLAHRAHAQIAITASGESVRATDGFELTAIVMREKGPDSALFDHARAVLFFVQGSEYVSVTNLAPQLASAVTAGIPAICVERRGVTPDGKVDVELADRTSALRQRVSDFEQVMHHFLPRIPAKTPILLAGGSEGATVAGCVAVDEPRVTQLLILAGGGWSQARELRQLVLDPRHPLGAMKPEELELGIAKIRKEPDTFDAWLGHPHHRWSSFLWHSPLDDLVRLDIPIFVAHGTEDTSAPIESARAIRDGFLERGKTNLTYVELEGLDHGWKVVESGSSAYPRLELEMIRFLADQGIVTSVEAKALDARTRLSHPELFGPKAK